MSLTYTTTNCNILCTATDVGMHGLLASQSCYHSVLPSCLSTLLASSRFLLISLEIFFIYLLHNISSNSSTEVIIYHYTTGTIAPLYHYTTGTIAPLYHYTTGIIGPLYYLSAGYQGYTSHLSSWIQDRRAYVMLYRLASSRDYRLLMIDLQILCSLMLV